MLNFPSKTVERALELLERLVIAVERIADQDSKARVTDLNAYRKGKERKW